MPDRKITALDPLITITNNNSPFQIIDLDEALPEDQNKKITFADLVTNIEGELAFGTGTVKISSNDTTPDFIINKFVEGTNITLTENNDGGVETLTIDAASTPSPLSVKGDLFTYDTGDARLPVGADGQILSANSATATGLEWIAAPGGGEDYFVENYTGAFPTISAGVENLVIGGGATYTGTTDATIVMGLNATGGSAASVVIGRDSSNPTGSFSVVIGRLADSSSQSSVVIGNTADGGSGATGVVSIGSNSNSFAIGGVAVGQDSVVSSNRDYGVAIGDSAAASGTGTNQVSIGKDSRAFDDACISVGFNADSTEPRGISIGSNANNDATDAIAIGTNTDISAAGTNAIAIGDTAQVTAAGSIQFGTGTNSTGATIQYLSSRLANAQGLYTSFTSPVNYTPADDDNVTSHFQAIDTALGTIDTKQALVSANDTTEGYLFDKIVAGTGVVITELNDAGDEDLQIQAGLVLTSEQTGTINANVNDLIPVDVSAGTATVNPPASPAANDTFAVSDSRGNALTNNITVDFVTATQNLHGTSQNDVININEQYREYVYVDSTIGWIRRANA